MTDFEKKYALDLVEKELKKSETNYNQALKRNAPFEQVLNLAKKKIAREQIAYIVRRVIESGMGDEL